MTETQTWVVNSYNYDLWVIGAQRSVFDVKLSFAVPTDESGSIDITWVNPDKADYGSGDVSSLQLTEGGALSYSAYRDTYASGDPDPSEYGFGVNGTPLMGDGSPVPGHGVFPRDYYEYFIGECATRLHRR